MNKKVYSFEKFTDSYIMYKKKVPKFLLYIILLICISIIGLIVFSSVINKPYIVKSQGIIEVSDKSYIMPKTSGTITNIYFNDGDEVLKDDIIFSLNTLEIDSQINILDNSINTLDSRKELFDRLINYIRDDVEIDLTFNKDDNYELEFYNYLQSFISQYSLYLDQTSKENYKASIVNQYLSTWYEIDRQINDYIVQKNNYLEQKELYLVRAESDGVIVLNSRLSIGLVLSAGSNVGQVVNNDDDIYIEAYLSTNDRPKINIDDEVNVAINGLSQNEYGTIKGKVISISKDSIVSNDNRLYIVIIKIEKDSISNSKGETIDLKVGMSVESRIIYSETTYLKYFLEQIGIKIK